MTQRIGSQVSAACLSIFLVLFNICLTMICSSVSLSRCLTIFLPFYMYVSVFPSIHLPVPLSVYTSVHPSTYLPACVCLHLSLSFHMPTMCLSIHLQYNIGESIFGPPGTLLFTCTVSEHLPTISLCVSLNNPTPLIPNVGLFKYKPISITHDMCFPLVLFSSLVKLYWE